jgi:hypothetical protein
LFRHAPKYEGLAFGVQLVFDAYQERTHLFQ